MIKETASLFPRKMWQIESIDQYATWPHTKRTSTSGDAMISAYLQKRTIAALGYIGLMAALAVRNNFGTAHRDDGLKTLLLFACLACLVSACWFYLKAKNRNGGWLLLLPLNLIAFIIYWMMEDCSDEPDEVKCPSCTAANFLSDAHCRLSQSSLAAAIDRSAAL